MTQILGCDKCNKETQGIECRIVFGRPVKGFNGKSVTAMDLCPDCTKEMMEKEGIQYIESVVEEPSAPAEATE